MQLIKWTGSKRSLAEEIISYFPSNIKVFYEPFIGSAQVTYNLIKAGTKIDKFICSDVNSSLITFYNTLLTNKESILHEYVNRWTEYNSKDIDHRKNYYYHIRDSYNKNGNVHDFYFLTRTSYTGLIRYNKSGKMNAPCHFSRPGIEPETLDKIIKEWYTLLSSVDIEFKCNTYLDINPAENDYVFCDPPYTTKALTYYGKISMEEYFKWLDKLKCRWSFTLNSKDNEEAVPAIYTNKVYLSPKKSSYSRLKRDTKLIQEVLYVK
jgi:DNA adenine methylase